VSRTNTHKHSLIKRSVYVSISKRESMHAASETMEERMQLFGQQFVSAVWGQTKKTGAINAHLSIAPLGLLML